MGKYVLNMSGGIDWATPEQTPFVELHMQLPISEEVYATFTNLMRAKDFSGARDLLIHEYPHWPEVTNGPKL